MDGNLEPNSVSVVIPCFNAGPYLRESIDSALAQSFPALEVIVVDDGSTDGSAEVAASYGGIVRCIRQTNSGPSAARNRGAKEAVGKLIVFVDADDRLHPGCIEARVSQMAGDGRCAAVMGAFCFIDSEGGQYGEPQAASVNEEVSYGEARERMSCPTLGLSVRRSAFLEIGGFDEGLRIAEDSDFLIRMTAKYKCLVDPIPRADYRILPRSLSRDYVLWFDSFRLIAKRHGIRWVALANLTADRVFGKMRKEEGGRFAGQVGGLFARRPLLIVFFGYWLARALVKRSSIRRQLR